MLRRWHVLLLIVVTLAAFGVLAAAKLRATPRFDRIQVGMKPEEVTAVLGQADGMSGSAGLVDLWWDCEEGGIAVEYNYNDEPVVVTRTSIIRRSPLERLAWVAGWR